MEKDKLKIDTKDVVFNEIREYGKWLTLDNRKIAVNEMYMVNDDYDVVVNGIVEAKVVYDDGLDAEEPFNIPAGDVVKGYCFSGILLVYKYDDDEKIVFSMDASITYNSEDQVESYNIFFSNTFKKLNIVVLDHSCGKVFVYYDAIVRITDGMDENDSVENWLDSVGFQTSNCSWMSKETFIPINYEDF